MKRTLVLTSVLAIVATGAAKADTTDVTFAGNYEATTGTKNVGTGAPSAYGFTYFGTQANGNPTTSSISSNTTTGVDMSNFEYTLADGVTTEDLSLGHTFTAGQYTADTVAGTTGFENVSVASDYVLDARLDNNVEAGSFYYVNPQGGTKQLVLDSANNPVVDSLTTEFTYSDASQQFTGGVSNIEVNSGSTTLDGTAYTLLTDTAGNVYTLSADGAGILMNGVAYTGTPVGELETNFNDAHAAYDADALLFAGAVTDLGSAQDDLNANALQAKNAYLSDKGAHDDLVQNYATYTSAQTAYTNANNEYQSKLSNYNADSAAYTVAADLYNSPIETTITQGANDAITASLNSTDDGTIGAALNTVTENLATNYSTTAQIEEGITNLIATKEANISEQLGYDVTKNPANADEPNSLTSKLKSHDTSIVAAINTNYDAIAEINNSDVMQSGIDATKVAQIATNTAAIATEKSEREAADNAIRSEFAAADALTLGAAKAYADAGNTLMLNQAKAYTDERVEKLDKDLSAGVASAIALSSVSVSNVNKGELSVGGGYGYFNGQSAAAFGAAMGLSNRWSVNAGAGISGSDVSLRAGTNYKFKLF